MLEVAASHCLRPPSSENQRHEFQTSVLELMEGVVTTERCRRHDIVESLKERVANEIAVRNTQESSLSAATAHAAERKTVMEASKAEYKEAAVASKEADAIMATRLAHEAALGSERQLTLEAREAHQTMIAELWEPLKAFSFSGGQWRQRNKAAAQLAEEAANLGAPPSLSEALLPSLKVKPEERGVFTKLVLDHAQKLFSDRLAGLEAQLSGFEAEVSTRSQAVADAKAALEASREAEQVALQRSVDAENTWIEAGQEVVKLEASVNKSSQLVAKVEGEISHAIALRDSFSAEADTFSALLTGKSATPAVGAPPERTAEEATQAEEASSAEALR